LQVLYLMTIQTRHQYYNTLENTEHSYQIIQGTWVSNYCYKTYWNKNRLFWYWNYRTWRTACGTCRYFIFIRKGKDIMFLSRNKEDAQVLIDKFIPFSKMSQLKNWSKLKIWSKILSNTTLM
jgi:DNA polymerase-1